MLAMPLFFAVCLLAIDGAKGFVTKRETQNAADSAATAATRDLINGNSMSASCDAACIAALQLSVQSTVSKYSTLNGGSASIHACSDASDTDCYTYPYPSDGGAGDPSRGKVEVRLRISKPTFFAQVAGLTGFDFLPAKARAVGAVLRSLHCSLGDEYLPSCVIPGNPARQGTQQLAVNGAQAFTMSRACDAISYQGGGGTSGTVSQMGTLATNGGLTFKAASGSGSKKVVGKLLFDKSRTVPDSCLSLLPPPSGTAQCPNGTSESCVGELLDLTQFDPSPPLPMDWPVSPPAEPTPKTGTWNPAVDYPRSCINLGSRVDPVQ